MARESIRKFAQMSKELETRIDYLTRENGKGSPNDAVQGKDLEQVLALVRSLKLLCDELSNYSLAAYTTAEDLDKTIREQRRIEHEAQVISQSGEERVKIYHAVALGLTIKKLSKITGIAQGIIRSNIIHTAKEAWHNQSSERRREISENYAIRGQLPVLDEEDFKKGV